MALLCSCSKDNDNDPVPDTITIDCLQPDFLKAGDRVALISPSYFTPMENVEKTGVLAGGRTDHCSTHAACREDGIGLSL